MIEDSHEATSKTAPDCPLRRVLINSDRGTVGAPGNFLVSADRSTDVRRLFPSSLAAVLLLSSMNTNSSGSGGAVGRGSPVAGSIGREGAGADRSFAELIAQARAVPPAPSAAAASGDRPGDRAPNIAGRGEGGGGNGGESFAVLSVPGGDRVGAFSSPMAQAAGPGGALWARAGASSAPGADASAPAFVAFDGGSRRGGASTAGYGFDVFSAASGKEADDR